MISARTLVAFALVLGSVSAAAALDLRPTDVATIFFVAKSDDRNRVDYGLHVDEHCAPVGAAPIFPYWRRFETNEPPLGDLNMLDQQAYGIEWQTVRVRGAGGTWIEFRLRALPNQRMLILVRPRPEGGCTAEAHTEIDGRDARLERAFVQLNAIRMPEYMVVYGRELATGRRVSERHTR